MFIKPAPGLTVRDPDRGLAPIPVDGIEVPNSSYWLRRLADGDVVDATPAPRLSTKSNTGEAE